MGVINFPRWDDGYTTRKEFKQQAQEKFTHSETLRNITLTLQVSYTKYDPAEFNNASEFLGMELILFNMMFKKEANK